MSTIDPIDQHTTAVRQPLLEGSSWTLSRSLSANERYGEQFPYKGLPATPQARLAVIACMDTRMVVEEILGLSVGEAHIIRNAGAQASDEAISSLIISQQVLGTQAIVVLSHTDCGLCELDIDRLRERLIETTGATSDLPLASFSDLDAHVCVQVERLRLHPWLNTEAVHGLIYDVETGQLRQVD